MQIHIIMFELYCCVYT